MSSLPTPNIPTDAQGFDLGYGADIWKTGALPSYALIQPYIGTNQGFSLLRDLINDGRSDSIRLLQHLRPMMHRRYMATEHVKAIIAALEETASQTDTRLAETLEAEAENPDQINRLKLDLKHHDLKLIDAVNREADMKVGNHTLARFCMAVMNLHGTFETLDNINNSLDALQEEYGADYACDTYAIRKLTVCMHTLDCAWGRMRRRYDEMRRAEDGWVIYEAGNDDDEDEDDDDDDGEEEVDETSEQEQEDEQEEHLAFELLIADS